ncbi:MAG: hypothetical protein RLZZ436_3329 [Planctomycetota bacterium]
MQLQEHIGRDCLQLVAAVVLQPSGSDGVRSIADQSTFDGAALTRSGCQSTNGQFSDGCSAVSDFDGMSIGADSESCRDAASIEACFTDDIQKFRMHGSLKHPQHHVGGIWANVRDRHGR